MKFEYLGKGDESVFVPHKVKLEKKGQIIEVSSEFYSKELEKRPDKFRRAEGKSLEQKGKEKKKGGINNG